MRNGFQVSMAQVRAAAKSLIYTIYMYMTCEMDGFISGEHGAGSRGC